MFPMRVGMNRQYTWLEVYVGSVPHACGDEPDIVQKIQSVQMCSPCVWG